MPTPIKKRCTWPSEDPMMITYHDEEWGVAEHKDVRLFEFLILEGFQAGLSWRTILHKRDNFRAGFDWFDYNKVAHYTPSKVQKLMNDAGIVRNRLKIEAAILNAQAFLRVRAEFGTFDRYIWSFVDGKPIHNQIQSHHDIPAKTALSDQISKDLKKRGFKFVGSTIVYAFMQATGMVNDHLTTCFCHPSNVGYRKP